MSTRLRGGVILIKRGRDVIYAPDHVRELYVSFLPSGLIVKAARPPRNRLYKGSDMAGPTVLGKRKASGQYLRGSNDLNAMTPNSTIHANTLLQSSSRPRHQRESVEHSAPSPTTKMLTQSPRMLSTEMYSCQITTSLQALRYCRSTSPGPILLPRSIL